MLRMKKCLGLLTAVLLLFVTCASALAASFPFVTTTSADTTLRKTASSGGKALADIPAGATVVVSGESGSYYKVTYGGDTGYVAKKDLTALDGAAEEENATTATGYPYETTTSSQVNLRQGKSTSSKRLASIPEGATVTVSSVSGSYAEVTYNGVSGWCLKRYLNLKTIVKATATPTFSPTPAPAMVASNYVTLQMGSTGREVQALQEALIELGFLTGDADGLFGASTQAAVVALQLQNEYPATGIVDANLQAHIYAGKPKNAKGVKTDVKTLPPIEGVSITLNDRGQIVRDVQTRLQALGYYKGDISGVYDSATRKAVVSYQKAVGLKADGICGAQTQQALLGTNVVGDQTPTPTPEPTPTPAPTFQVPTATIRRGDTGDNVRLVQQRLIDLGYLTDKADGVFGAASVKALQAFQRKHGLTADGVAGPSTYAILFSYDALAVDQLPTAAPTAVPTATATAAPTATPTPAPITPDTVVTIREGSTGAEVLRLQQRLTQLGYYTAAMDGVCGAKDVAAIRAFQKKNGLRVDGVAGYDTQSLLYAPTALTYTGEMAGGTVDTFTTLRKGMTGEAVAQLQQRLIALRFLTGAADGIYGTKTAEAVYAFQKANGLVRDGIAGAKTLQKLYSTAVATPTPAPQTTPGASDNTIHVASGQTLRRGDINEAVRQLQQRLIALGYLKGKADGNFGAQTYAALVAFQQANDLKADGIAGKLTIGALNSSSAVGVGPSVTPAPTTAPSTGLVNGRVTAASVQYENWYSVIRAKARTYPYATVYDFETGISWQVHMFSLGAHADCEPLTAQDTARMEQAFGGNTWNPKAVWVVFGNGEVFIASTHSYPHDVQHITDNNFAGHMCIHFPRTQSQVTAIGPYATSHQQAIDDGWVRTQNMLK